MAPDLAASQEPVRAAGIGQDPVLLPRKERRPAGSTGPSSRRRRPASRLGTPPSRRRAGVESRGAAESPPPLLRLLRRAAHSCSEVRLGRPSIVGDPAD